MELKEEIQKRIINRLEEMAYSSDDGAAFSKMKSPTHREALFYGTEDHHIVSEHGDLKLHRHTKGNETKYTLLDHKKEEAVMQSTIIHHKAGVRDMPFDHDEQTFIDKQKDHPAKAWEHTYNHFKSSERPLTSSDVQTHQGKQLWHRMTHQAIQDGHHAYYRNEHGKMTKLTLDNLDAHVRKYHGNKFEHGSRNLILSKKELV